MSVAPHDAVLTVATTTIDTRTGSSMSNDTEVPPLPVILDLQQQKEPPLSSSGESTNNNKNLPEHDFEREDLLLDIESVKKQKHALSLKMEMSSQQQVHGNALTEPKP